MDPQKSDALKEFLVIHSDVGREVSITSTALINFTLALPRSTQGGKYGN
jgi:hypothetical protein